jgi:hypothetical protein
MDFKEYINEEWKMGDKIPTKSWASKDPNQKVGRTAIEKDKQVKRLGLTYKGWGVYKNERGDPYVWDNMKHKFVHSFEKGVDKNYKAISNMGKYVENWNKDKNIDTKIVTRDNYKELGKRLREMTGKDVHFLKDEDGIHLADMKTHDILKREVNGKYNLEFLSKIVKNRKDNYIEKEDKIDLKHDKEVEDARDMKDEQEKGGKNNEE